VYVAREVIFDSRIRTVRSPWSDYSDVPGRMGAYLSKPICEKESEDREGNVLSYGASAMQGWRLSQEVESETSGFFSLSRNTNIGLAP